MTSSRQRSLRGATEISGGKAKRGHRFTMSIDNFSPRQGDGYLSVPRRPLLENAILPAPCRGADVIPSSARGCAFASTGNLPRSGRSAERSRTVHCCLKDDANVRCSGPLVALSPSRLKQRNRNRCRSWTRLETCIGSGRSRSRSDSHPSEIRVTKRLCGKQDLARMSAYSLVTRTEPCRRGRVNRSFAGAAPS